MNDTVPAINQNQPVSKSGVLKPYLDKAAQVFKPLWNKFKLTRFYTNKKIFYTLSAMLGLIFLIVVLGILFGGPRKPVAPPATPTSTPVTNQISASPSPSGDVLSQIGQKLSDIKTQIGSLDVRQSRLQPPTIDFKISF